MITFPNCKINIGLYVTEKRPDGYHNLETLFFPVPLTDALEILPAETSQTTLSISGIDVTGDAESNLVMRAYRLLEADFSLPAVQFFLHKRIPFGAGLGGGSADAAFTLKMLNELFSLQLTSVVLQRYAARLGADCAFFIDNLPSLATGIGDVLQPVEVPLKGRWIALIKPPVGVSTQEAYAGIVPKLPKMPLKEQITTPLNEWKNLIINDFEQPIFRKYPIIANIKQRLYDDGAIYASMSGSGSSVFGIFEEKPVLNFDNQYFTFIAPL